MTHTNSGEGLLFFGNTTIPFVDRVPQNTELYAIMTTRPEDKKQEMNRAPYIIHFIRHGSIDETLSGKYIGTTDVPLSDKGKIP